MHLFTNLTHRGFLKTVCCISDPAHPPRLPHRRRQIAQASPWRQTSNHELADQAASMTVTGALLGAVVPAALQPACMTAKGVSRGEWMHPKTQHESMTVAAPLRVVQRIQAKTLGSTTARDHSTVAARPLGIRRGITTATEPMLGKPRPRAARRGITIRLVDMSGVRRSRWS